MMFKKSSEIVEKPSTPNELSPLIISQRNNEISQLVKSGDKKHAKSKRKSVQMRVRKSRNIHQQRRLIRHTSMPSALLSLDGSGSTFRKQRRARNDSDARLEHRSESRRRRGSADRVVAASR
jgi:hypothetical protein